MNPGAGPHGFGGTYKRGEKGGLRSFQDQEQVPLAERGLKGKATDQQQAASHSWKKSSAGSTASLSTTIKQHNSASQIKSKIRDLTRLLNKPNLDPTVKKHKERELVAVQKALAEKLGDNKAEKIDAKYKTVKFYERRKITRKLAGLQRQLATLFSKQGGDQMSTEEKKIRQQITKWQADADYIDFYPSGEKYISLFRSAAGGNDGEKKDESDGEEGEAADSKKTPASAAAGDASVESARAAMRKRVAQLKANAVRKEREEAGTTAPAKRKREDKTDDALFQEASDDDEEDEKKKADAKPPTKKSKANDGKASAPAVAKKEEEEEEEEADELMMSASSSEDEADEDDAPMPPPPSSKKKKATTPTEEKAKEKKAKK